MSTEALKAGQIFAEKYRLEQLLGSGGFARVYLATEESLGRKVALKILHPAGSSSVAPDEEKLARFFKRFEREAKVISRLKAAETVALYEYGTTNDGLAFMALEYVEGSNLWQIMGAEGKLSPSRVEKILIGVLRGLREAHQLGVHHRDLKPANIMIYSHLGERDLVKLLDFGVVKISRDVGVSYSSLTTEGNVVGTPRYMAPEYITDNVVSPQTDLYALGLVAYELLTGDSVVSGETAMEVMTAHITPESAQLPKDLEVHERLRVAVNGMLEKDLERRFQSADEVLELLVDSRLAGHTQDELSIARTVESSSLVDTANSVPAPDPAPSPDSPAELAVPQAAEPPVKSPKRRAKPRQRTTSHRGSEIEIDESALRKPTSKPDRATSGGLDMRIVFFAVFVGLAIGAILWWSVRG